LLPDTNGSEGNPIGSTEVRVSEAESERRRRFDELFAAFGAGVVSYCRWRASSASDAQDAVAEVFLTAWRRLDTLPERDTARIWLYATARRVVANQRRSARRRAALEERLALEPPNGSQGEPLGEEELLVHEALRVLPARDREVLLLAEWEGLSPAEIASVLGCLAVTARGRLHRARTRFRAAVEELRAPVEEPSLRDVRLLRPLPRRTS
jgi:RNA polymerase sigma factor (sigma-70 family)